MNMECAATKINWIPKRRLAFPRDHAHVSHRQWTTTRSCRWSGQIWWVWPGHRVAARDPSGTPSPI